MSQNWIYYRALVSFLRVLLCFLLRGSTSEWPERRAVDFECVLYWSARTDLLFLFFFFFRCLVLRDQPRISVLWYIFLSLAGNPRWSSTIATAFKYTYAFYTYDFWWETEWWITEHDGRTKWGITNPAYVENSVHWHKSFLLRHPL